MPYTIPSPARLRRILWIDSGAGLATAALALPFSEFWAETLGLSAAWIMGLGLVNLLYGSFSFSLARVRVPAMQPLLGLIYANYAWSVISVGLLFWHWEGATLVGRIILVLQIFLVGGLAFIEQRQLRRAE